MEPTEPISQPSTQSWQDLAQLNDNKPDAVLWLEQVDSKDLNYDWFISACKVWIEWKSTAIGSGDHMQEPHLWATPESVARINTVVTWWPIGAPRTLPPPKVIHLIDSLRVYEGKPAQSLNDVLDQYVDRVKVWIVENKLNVDNPNETKEERGRRLNRERQRRYQAGVGKNPEMASLSATAAQELESLKVGKAWLREEKKLAKAAEREALKEVRLAYNARVKAAELAVEAQEERLQKARDAINNYYDLSK